MKYLYVLIILIAILPVVNALNESRILIAADKANSLQVNGVSLTGNGQAVCVLDTGVNYNHHSLGECYGNNDPSSACKVIGGYDFVNNDSDPMDDNGHGTHVAGIISSNYEFIGIAPEAKILALKVCDENFSGHQDQGGYKSCTDERIKNAIDWCVNNSEIFYISVISASIGSGDYQEICDDIDDPYNISDSINKAVSKNISVVFASGNHGSTTHVASPACMKNVIAVASTDKNDSISWFSSRNSKVKLMAPGNEILSTNMHGGYWYDSGTSQSAPHVAGAIVLMNQYLEGVNRSKTPNEIEAILANTGKKIRDYGSNLTFSRINAYSSLIYLDKEKPVVSVEIRNSTSELTINCSGSDLALKGVSLSIWNSSSLHQRKTLSFPGINSYSYSYTFALNPGQYMWGCSYIDANRNTRSITRNKITIN